MKRLNRDFAYLLVLLTFLAILLMVTPVSAAVVETVVDDPEPVDTRTIIDVPDPVGMPCLIEICKSPTLLDTLGAGHGIIYPNYTEGIRIITKPAGMYESFNDWERMDFHTRNRALRNNVWITDPGMLAIPTQSECQDSVDAACNDEGHGTGQAGDASVGPTGADGCALCSGRCTGGCNENGCPTALFQFCED